MWTIDPVALTLVNHHTGSKYPWGLEEKPKDSFYVKDKTKCTGTTWYKITETLPKGQTQPSGRRKRQTASGAVCLAQTFMGHTITPKEVSEGNETQIWKMKLSDIKGKKGGSQTDVLSEGVSQMSCPITKSIYNIKNWTRLLGNAVEISI
mgnify:CR=1 FL=1